MLSSRYRVLARLGRGGMARVFRVHDMVEQRDVALKQLAIPHATSAGTARRVSELFQLEFHTLVHLAHPRIVQAYDYSTDATGAYYTMELLDGGDLRRREGLTWRDVCALLCDVCSALSLLHSRRLVHRDLTPTNVRCTEDGKAKLIDLGALAPMGLCKTLVGTPPFVAPESLGSQTIDERTDLFALGATAYFALTRKQAFPAKELSDLHALWRSAPLPPSHYAPDVPAALDELVLSMLQLSPLARPASAAEVMERLSAIGNVSIDEQRLEQRAFLSTPRLVGRNEPLARVRKRLLRVARGQGGAVTVIGGAGTGRTRFVDAIALEAKLLGFNVVRTDATDIAGQEWDGARALSHRLLELVPEAAERALAPHLAALADLLPELMPEHPHDERAPDASLTPQQRRTRVSEALRDWWLAISGERPLALVVDDLEAFDEASAALLVLVAREAGARRLVVVVSARSERQSEAASSVTEHAGDAARSECSLAAAWLVDAGTAIKLRDLSAADTESLLQSVFGDVPNLRLLASRVYSASRGNPRRVMQLAQHLLERGVVRYRAGAWTLPVELDAAELPTSEVAVLEQRLSRLSYDARLAASGLALGSLTGLTVPSCSQLLGHDDAITPEALRALDELVRADMVVTDGHQYSLAEPGLRTLLPRLLSRDEQQVAHARLAALLEGLPMGRVKRAQHLLWSGAPNEALAVLNEHVAAYLEAAAENTVTAYAWARALPRGWERTARALLEHAQALTRPARELFELRYFVLVSLAVTAKVSHGEHRSVMQELATACGLDLHAQLDPNLPESERLQIFFNQAQQRYDATPQAQRTLAPAEAIPRIARVMMFVIALAGRGLDRAMLAEMPSLQPLVPLSPAIGVIEGNRKVTLDLLAGRTLQAIEGYRDLIALLDRPEGVGLDSANHQGMRSGMMVALASVELTTGIPSALQWADRLEHDVMFRATACQVRMQHALHQGKAEQAAQLARHLELLRMQDQPPEILEGTWLWVKSLALVGSGDLVGTKQVLPELSAMADEFDAWKPCLQYVLGEYQLLRGDATRARAELERGLQLCAAGKHLAWPRVVGAYVSTLLSLGELEHAQSVAEQALEQARAEQLTGLPHYIESPLAMVVARLGDHARARKLAEGVLALHEELGATGMLVGRAHELCALVALEAKDPERFHTHAKCCAEQYRTGSNPVLTAKYERLLVRARSLGIEVSTDLARAAGQSAHRASSLLDTPLEDSRGVPRRALRALAMLVRESDALGGYLFLLRDDGLSLAACTEGLQPMPHLATMAQDYIDGELRADEQTKVLETSASAPSSATDSSIVPTLLAHSVQQERKIVGVAFLLRRDQQRALCSPVELAGELSRALLAVGDVNTVIRG